MDVRERGGERGEGGDVRDHPHATPPSMQIHEVVRLKKNRKKTTKHLMASFVYARTWTIFTKVKGYGT